jgi:hypothetical protein
MTYAPTLSDSAICESLAYEPTTGAPLYELMNRYSDARDDASIRWSELVAEDLLNPDSSAFA